MSMHTQFTSLDADGVAAFVLDRVGRDTARMVAIALLRLTEPPSPAGVAEPPQFGTAGRVVLSKASRARMIKNSRELLRSQGIDPLDLIEEQPKQKRRKPHKEK